MMTQTEKSYLNDLTRSAASSARHLPTRSIKTEGHTSPNFDGYGRVCPFFYHKEFMRAMLVFHKLTISGIGPVLNYERKGVL